MNCLICGNHFAGPSEICCECLPIAFPNGVPPEWVREAARHSPLDVRTPQPIS
jgi:hypothetical protein